MRRLSLRPKKSKHLGFFGSAAEDRAQAESDALAAGVSMADWQAMQMQQLEQKILGMYNAALATLGAANMQLLNVEEGNALINFLVENETTPYTDADIIDLVKSVRAQIASGEIPATVAAEPIGKDVRPALFKLLSQPGSSLEIKKKAAMLYKLLESIRELFYIQMLNAMQGKIRDRSKDVEIQKYSEKAKKIGSQLGMLIETNYTLSLFDKLERLVADNLDQIDFGQDEQGYFFSSSDQTIDDAMSVLSTSAESASVYFDEYLSKPAMNKSLMYGIVGLLIGMYFAKMRKK